MQKVFIGIALIVSLVFTTSPITRAESTSTPIRLASFNMLTYRPNNDRAPTSWDAPDFRKNLIIKTIVDNNWDVAGLQEVSGAFRRNDNTFTLSQLEFVKNNLESAGYSRTTTRLFLKQLNILCWGMVAFPYLPNRQTYSKKITDYRAHLSLRG